MSYLHAQRSYGMAWFHFCVICSIALLATASALWLTLYGKVRPWLWWLVMGNGIVFILHAGVHFFSSPAWRVFAHVSAVVNAGLLLLAAVTAKRSIAKIEHLEDAARITAQEIHVDRTASLQLIELLNGYKSKIEYYEDQSVRHGLAPYSGPKEVVKA